MMAAHGETAPDPTLEVRRAAREIFQHALAESSIARAFERHVEYRRGVLRIMEDLYNLDAYKRVFVVSMGKAGNALARSLAAQVGSWAEGIVVANQEETAMQYGLRYFCGGHPVPSAESVRAAEAILRALEALKEGDLAMFMISGGASSLVEKPLAEEITLDDLVATYQALVHSGAPIAEINAIRKHLSAVKGGRLARAAAGASRQVSILISDVPDTKIDSLASGPTMPDSTTVEDCYRLARDYGMMEQFPAATRKLFEQRALEETPKAGDKAFGHSRWWTILSSATLEEEAAAKAGRQGFAVDVDDSCDDWDYARAAEHLLTRVREMRRKAGRVCLISAGEVTVKVGPESGKGGRNQQFALYCAKRVAGENIVVLSAGTDGIDGNSTAAGALVDGSTLARARARGLDLVDALNRFDAHPVFEVLGDAIVTGPTGTNVRDLRLLLAY
ncbi:MAG: glycerate kinase type-2 family protein [Terriglobales bacterium]